MFLSHKTQMPGSSYLTIIISVDHIMKKNVVEERETMDVKNCNTTSVKEGNVNFFHRGKWEIDNFMLFFLCYIFFLSSFCPVMFTSNVDAERSMKYTKNINFSFYYVYFLYKHIYRIYIHMGICESFF